MSIVTDSEGPRLPLGLVERAGVPALAPLFDELARRLGTSERPVRQVRLHGLDVRQREALADLLGLARLPGPVATVSTTSLCAALRIDEPALHRLVAVLRGPIGNRADARARDDAARRGLWAEVTEAVAGRGLDAWVGRLRAAGVPDGDIAAHRERLAPILGLVAALPLSAPEPLALVAQRHLGDPHGLDPGTWPRTLVADAAASLIGAPTPSVAEDARGALAAVGIVPDRVSSPVLTLGLRGSDGSDPIAAWLDALADDGEPAALTASQLRRWPVRATHHEAAVVENPSVLAAAASRGVSGVPLVCTASWPTEAGVLLLDQLRSAGVALRYHSDLDATGLALTGHLARRFGASPWRMTAADYLAAVDDARIALAPTELPPTPWDPALRTAMQRHARVVFEEQVVDVLLEDLT